MAEHETQKTAPAPAGNTASRLKVLGNPLRIRILEELAIDVGTVKELARRLGEPQTKLYRHIHLLEKHGFLEESAHRTVSGIVEKIYKVNTEKLRFEAPFTQEELPVAVDAVEETLRATFADTLREIHEGLQSGVIDLSDPDACFMGMRGRMQLTEEQAELFIKRFFELLEEFKEYHDAQTGEDLYSFTMAFHPSTTETRPPKKSPSDDSESGRTEGGSQ